MRIAVYGRLEIPQRIVGIFAVGLLGPSVAFGPFAALIVLVLFLFS